MFFMGSHKQSSPASTDYANLGLFSKNLPIWIEVGYTLNHVTLCKKATSHITFLHISDIRRKALDNAPLFKKLKNCVRHKDIDLPYSESDHWST